MIAEVTAGWRVANATAIWTSVSPASSAHEVRQRSERLVDVGVRIEPVELVDIDVVGLQPAQRRLDRVGQPAPRTALHVHVVAHRQVRFGGEHYTVASALQRLSDDLLRLTAAVSVGGVDKVNPGVQRLVDDANSYLVFRIT